MHSSIAFVASLLFVGLTAATAETAPPNPNLFQCPDASHATTFDVQIVSDGPRFTLTVPEGYFAAHAVPRDGSQRRGALLDIDPDDFGPWRRADAERPEGVKALWMLVTEYVPIERLAHNAASLAVNDLAMENDTPYPVADGPHGLKQTVLPSLDRPSLYPHDVFTARDAEGRLTDVITCDRPEAIGHVMLCQHRMEAGVADLKVTYLREHLPRWAAFSANARALFACFLNE